MYARKAFDAHRLMNLSVKSPILGHMGCPSNAETMRIKTLHRKSAEDEGQTEVRQELPMCQSVSTL